MTNTKFSRPRLVFSALELAGREPELVEVGASLLSTVDEVVSAGLAEVVSVRRGRVVRLRVRLTAAGRDRLAAARDAALSVAAGVPLNR
jgi:hypothetical protein